MLHKFFAIIEKNSDKLLFLWLLLLSVLYATLSIVRHNTFQSGGFDLGIYDQSVWQYAHFLTPYSTIKERLILGDHLTLTLPFLAPLFYIWDNVRILLIFQAFWLTFSSFAIYKICTLRKLPSFSALCISVVYSLFFGIQTAIFFDFHPIIIGVGLIAWLAYFLEAKKNKLLLITYILVILTQENMGLAIACLGIYYFFQKPYRKQAIFFILSGIIFSIIAIKMVTLFSPIGYEYSPKIPLNPLTILHNFFDAKDKRDVLLYSFSWFSFLPLFSPGALLAILFDLAQYFVTGPDFMRMWSPYTHHRAILAPLLVLGTIDALILFKKFKMNLSIIALILLLVALCLQFYFHFPLNKLSKAEYWKHEHWMDDNNVLFSKIPYNASIVTQQNLVPHLSHRNEIYVAWPRKKEKCSTNNCWELQFGGKPQYLVVDTHPNQWITQLLETNENFQSAVNNMVANKKIVLVKQINDAKLYRVVYE